jgi:predicted metallo-beta-lactamase superfamily hydrolase
VESLVGELNSKVENIENEMDIRLESLIIQVHDVRDEYRSKLDKMKEEFKEFV